MTRTFRAAMLATAVILAACGGGADEDGDLGEDVFGGLGETSEDQDSGDGGSSGGAVIGAVTQTADPSTGWVEVEGQRYEFEAIGSIHHTCEVLDDRITVNFQQTTSGNEFLLQGSVLEGQWNANLTFKPDDDSQVSYGAVMGSDPGTLGLGDQVLSYEGTVSRVEGVDVQNAQDVDATIAVNCSPPGGGTTAEIGGETLTFPLSGAQGLDCSVSDGEVDVLISHVSPDRKQLQVTVMDNSGELLGGVFVTSDVGKYDSTIPADGTGLNIVGSSLTYEGLFTTPEGEEVEGSVSVSCG